MFFYLIIDDRSNCNVVLVSLQLKDLIVQLLEKQRLTHGEVLAFATPRRLVVWSLLFTFYFLILVI